MKYKIVKESIINFERGLIPLDSMNIGLKNNPIKIFVLYNGHYYIRPKEGRDILQKLSKSQSILGYDDLWFFEETNSSEGDAYPLEEIRGKWIEYESILYHIPIK